MYWADLSGGSTWSQVEDFPAGANPVYRVNPVTSEISFGNFDPLGLTGNGSPTGLITNSRAFFCPGS